MKISCRGLVAGDLVQVPSAKNSTLGYFTVGMPISSFSTSRNL